MTGDAQPLNDCKETRARLMADVVAHSRRMLADGLVQGTAGNISVRDGDEVIITPSSQPYDSLKADDLCVVDLAGEQLSGGDRPSAETPLHTLVYRTTPARAVVHTHSTFATTLACSVDELPAIHYAIHRFGGDSVRVGDYARFGSGELAEATTAALDGRRAVLLRNHGALVFADSLAEAYDLAQLLEWLAEVYWRAAGPSGARLLQRTDVEEVAAEASRRRYGRDPATV